MTSQFGSGVSYVLHGRTALDCFRSQTRGDLIGYHDPQLGHAHTLPAAGLSIVPRLRPGRWRQQRLGNCYEALA
jgi:hypothetical protein